MSDTTILALLETNYPLAKRTDSEGYFAFYSNDFRSSHNFCSTNWSTGIYGLYTRTLTEATSSHVISIYDLHLKWCTSFG